MKGNVSMVQSDIALGGASSSEKKKRFAIAFQIWMWDSSVSDNHTSLQQTHRH